MICDFSQMKKQNEMLEQKLQTMKQDYMKLQMKTGDFRRLLETMEETKKKNRYARLRKNIAKITASVAAVAAAFVILPNTSASVAHAMNELPLIGSLIKVVTFRDYDYESERNIAHIEVPKVTQSDVTGNPQVQETLEQTLNEINVDIQRITDEIIAQFEAYLHDEQGYQDYIVKSDVLATTKDYFSMKLMCYQGAGSGYQWNYYYTVDLKTGERLKLKDLFLEGSDYLTPISENIKQQMQANMDADENVHYWLHDEIEELNFKTIYEDTSFYVNERGNIVIAFDEGDVAPMYMGALEFEIPSEVLKSIRK